MEQLIIKLIIILLISPLTILLLHSLIYRVFLLFFKRRLSGHASGILAVFMGNLPVLFLTWYFVLSYWIATPQNLISGLLYTLIIYNMLGLLHLATLNISETSLHTHILLEIAWAGKLTLESLREKYSITKMIDVRIERLTSLKQIRCENNRYYLDNNRTILFISRALDIWRKVLGVPLRPNVRNKVH